MHPLLRAARITDIHITVAITTAMAISLKDKRMTQVIGADTITACRIGDTVTATTMKTMIYIGAASVMMGI